MRNREFQLDAEVLSLGGRQLVIGLSWLRENGFILDPVNRTLENKTLGCVVQCSELNLPKVTSIEPASELTPALTSGTAPTLEIAEEDCIFVLYVVSEYSKYLEVFSEELANRLPPLRK